LPVYRSDGSGTTFIFTDYLSKVSSEWANKVGKDTSVKWPAGIGQKGNEGIAGMVRQSPYSFGYVELIYALQNKMAYGAVKNAAGKFLQGSPEGVTAAAAAAAKTMPADYRVSITNAPGAASYPISSFTYLLIPLKFADPAKGAAVKGLPDLDAGTWRERGHRHGLCAASGAGADDGEAHHYDHQVNCECRADAMGLRSRGMVFRQEHCTARENKQLRNDRDSELLLRMMAEPLKINRDPIVHVH
jgi:hypothetical protein